MTTQSAPAIPAQFIEALTDVTERMRQEFGSDLIGILFTGSAATGNIFPRSDIDLFIIIRPLSRQRRTFVSHGVEVETFINPPIQIQREIGHGLASTVIAFAHGQVLADSAGQVYRLCEQARRKWENPPTLSGAEARALRYGLTDMLKDAQDLYDVESRGLDHLLATTTHQAVEAYFRARGKWTPKVKYQLSQLLEHDKPFADLVSVCLDSRRAPGLRVEMLEKLCELSLQPVGGLLTEYSTDRESVAP